MPSSPFPSANSSAIFAAATLISVDSGIPSRNVGTLESAASATTSPVDYYKFKTTAASTNLNVKLTGLDGNARLDVYARDANNNFVQQTLSSDEFSGTLSESYFRNNLPPGEYLVRVERETGTAATPAATSINYALSVLASRDGSATSIVWQDGGLGIWQMNGVQLGEVSGLVTGGYQVVGVGDFNGDKTDDLVLRATGAAAASENNLAIWLLNRDNTLNSGSFLAGGIGAAGTVAGVEDLDGDGKSDLIVRNGDAIRFIGMNGATILQEKTISIAGLSQFKITGFGDFDGDNNRDVLLEGPSVNGSRDLVMWFIDDELNLKGTSGSFFAALPDAFEIRAIEDFNSSVASNGTSSDQNDDLLLYNRLTGQTAVWLLNGLQIKESNFLVNGAGVPLTFSIADVADMNGDGDADIIWQGPNTGVWLISGARLKPDANAANSANFLQVPISPEFRILGARDFDNDNKADILFRRTSAPEVVAVWLMDGVQIKTMQTGPNTQAITGETANFVKTPGTETNINLPNSFQIKGFVETEYIKTDQGRGSGNPVEAFDLGKLGDVESKGTYTESFTNTAKRYYKFTLSRSSRVAVTTAPGTAVIKRQVGLVPSATDPDANPNSLPTPNLGAGNYYIEMTPGNTTQPIALTVDVKPSVQNLRGAGLSAQTGSATNAITLDFPDGATGVGPETAITTAFKLDNIVTGQVATDSDPVEVDFYLSKTQQIVRDATTNALNPRETVFLGQRTVPSVPGGGEQSITLLASNAQSLKLPGAASDFWTGDGTYYIVMQTDPANKITETNETDNVGRGLTLDIAALTINNTQTADIYGAGLTAGSLSSSTGEVSVTYTAANRGRRNTDPGNGNSVGVRFYLFKAPIPTTPDGIDFVPGSGTVNLNPSTALGGILTPIAGAPSNTTPTIAPPRNLTLTVSDTTWLANNPLAAGEGYFIGIEYNPAGGALQEDRSNNFSQGLGLDIVQVNVA